MLSILPSAFTEADHDADYWTAPSSLRKPVPIKPNDEFTSERLTWSQPDQRSNGS
jgi:hypothetical protein